jgi:hypothetical protein
MLRRDGWGPMKVEKKDDRHCFKCGRDLGPLLEWKKMDTEAGPICYVCYNQAADEIRHQEQPR